MATPLSADAMVRALRAEGVRVVEHRSWRSHNRNHMGAWGPVHGVIIHHTVTSGTDSSVALCYNGHSQLPGPLCHAVGAKDGTVYLVGHGRANHAGAGDGDVLAAVKAERDLPADNQTDTDGNRHFYGLEAINRGDGQDPWPEAQVDAIARWAAGICRAHGWSEKSVIGHKEWRPGKVDPRPTPGSADVSMDAIRARVKKLLAAKPGGSGGGPSDDEGGLDMDKAEVYAAVWQQDKVAAPDSSNTKDTNPTWRPDSFLREIYDEVRALSKKVDDLAKKVNQ